MSSELGDDYIARTIWCRGLDSFERPMPQLVRRLSSCQSLVAIVGANTGFYVLQALASALNCRVLAFEPLPRARSVLLRNLELNGVIDKVRVIDRAASEETCRATLFLPPQVFGSVIETSATLSETFNLETGSRIDVETTTLDESLEAENRRLSLVVIDVEGFELSVLKGGLKVLQKHRPHILIEVLPSRGADLCRLQELVQQIEYDTWALSPACCTLETSIERCCSMPNQWWVPRELRDEVCEIGRELGIMVNAEGATGH